MASVNRKAAKVQNTFFATVLIASAVYAQSATAESGTTIGSGVGPGFCVDCGFSAAPPTVLDLSIESKHIVRSETFAPLPTSQTDPSRIAIPKLNETSTSIAANVASSELEKLAPSAGGKIPACTAEDEANNHLYNLGLSSTYPAGCRPSSDS